MVEILTVFCACLERWGDIDFRGYADKIVDQVIHVNAAAYISLRWRLNIFPSSCGYLPWLLNVFSRLAAGGTLCGRASVQASLVSLRMMGEADTAVDI